MGILKLDMNILLLKVRVYLHMQASHYFYSNCTTAAKQADIVAQNHGKHRVDVLNITQVIKLSIDN